MLYRQGYNLGDLSSKKEDEVLKSIDEGVVDWASKGEMCPFSIPLDDSNGTCSIYPIRPTMCATYFIQHRCVAPQAGELVAAANNFDIVSEVLEGSCRCLWDLGMLPPGEAAMPVPLGSAIAIGMRFVLAGKTLHEESNHENFV